MGIFAFMYLCGKEVRPWAASEDFWVRNIAILFATIVKIAIDFATEKFYTARPNCVKELADNKPDNVTLREVAERLACDTAEKQERFLEMQTHFVWVVAFLTAFSVKLVLVACSDWRAVAVSSIFFNALEWL